MADLDGPRPPLPSNTMSYAVNRRRFRFFTAVYVVLFVGGLLYHSRDLVQIRTTSNTLENDFRPVHTQNASCGKFESINYLRGPPTPSFRDNLKPGLKYVTTWYAGGFTNDVMGVGNLLYVARESGSIAVIPPFFGELDFYDSGQDAGFMHFGDVFDLPRLRQSLGMPLIEWRELKDIEAGRKLPLEPLGCWSLWQPYDRMNQKPRPNFITGNMQLALDLSYTPIAQPVKLVLDQPGEAHVSLNKVATLADHEVRLEILKTNGPARFEPEFPNLYPPDEQLTCFDLLYWGATQVVHEWQRSWSPVWKIGREFHWAPKLVAIAEQYLMRILEVQSPNAIPPFIMIHARRQDFGNWCQGRPKNECFATLDDFAVRVQEIQDELRTRDDLNSHDFPLKVMITGDERDQAWWDEVKKRGWLSIDHGPSGFDTAKNYGQWHMPLLDACIHSMAMGFIGTAESTFSLLSKRRVEDWNNGATRLVRWGFPGADNH